MGCIQKSKRPLYDQWSCVKTPITKKIKNPSVLCNESRLHHFYTFFLMKQFSTYFWLERLWLAIVLTCSTNMSVIGYKLYAAKTLCKEKPLSLFTERSRRYVNVGKQLLISRLWCTFDNTMCNIYHISYISVWIQTMFWNSFRVSWGSWETRCRTRLNVW